MLCDVRLPEIHANSFDWNKTIGICELVIVGMDMDGLVFGGGGFQNV